MCQPVEHAVRANELQEGATGSVPAACRNLTADGVTRLERFEREVLIVLRKKTLSAALSASE